MTLKSILQAFRVSKISEYLRLFLSNVINCKVSAQEKNIEKHGLRGLAYPGNAENKRTQCKIKKQHVKFVIYIFLCCLFVFIFMIVC